MLKLALFFSLLTVWLDIDGAMYKFETGLLKLSWEEADKYCRDLGGHLIRMETETEFTMIKTLLFANDGNLAILHETTNMQTSTVIAHTTLLYTTRSIVVFLHLDKYRASFNCPCMNMELFQPINEGTKY